MTNQANTSSSLSSEIEARLQEHALDYAMALMRNRLDVEAPLNAAKIREHISALERVGAALTRLTASAEREGRLRAALEARSRQLHRAERERTGTFTAGHGEWMGRVYDKWEECPANPCHNDRVLLAALQLVAETGQKDNA